MLQSIFLFILTASLVTGAVIDKRSIPTGVPSYVVDYAPIVYLYSGDPYRPSDLSAQLTYTQPEDNYTLITNAPSPLTLNNLADLNSVDSGTNVYLTSKTNVATNPAWLLGVEPDSTGKTNGAVSCAIIVNDHGNGNVDAFYMYFYAYNYGGLFLGQNLDDHVGDWEHNMIRFSNGKPTAVWYSQHDNGEAFAYSALLKDGLRPIVFSANGSHANYAINGTHDHTIPDLNLPDGLLVDYTDYGPIWDPTLSAYYHTYNANTKAFGAYDSSTPTNYLSFIGQWGDNQYPDSDPRQVNFLDLGLAYKYTSGPTGPEDKQLNRTDVCPDDGDLCVVRPILTV